MNRLLLWMVSGILLMGCTQEERTPRDIMASGLERALSDEVLGPQLSLEHMGMATHWASSLMAGWAEHPFTLRTDTLLDWTDGAQRMVIREQTRFNGEASGRFEGERIWTGNDFQQPRRVRSNRVKGDGKTLYLAHEQGEFRLVQDLDTQGLGWTSRLQGGWPLYMSLLGNQVRWEEAGTTTRSGKVLARLSAVWVGGESPLELAGQMGLEDLLGGRQIEHVDGEILIEPDSRRLREGLLSYALVAKQGGGGKRIQVTARFESAPSTPLPPLGARMTDGPVTPVQMEKKFRALRERQRVQLKNQDE